MWRRHHGQDLSNKPMVPGRDYFMDELLKGFKRAKVDAGVDGCGSSRCS